jgi:hypothetical protein
MHRSGADRPGTDPKLAGDLTVGSGSIGCRFFVTHANPAKASVAANGIHQRIERITRDPENLRNAGTNQGFKDFFADIPLMV